MRVRYMTYQDAADVADISVSAFEHDELFTFIYPRHFQYPSYLRGFNLIRIKQRLFDPTVYSLVAETTSSDGDLWHGCPEIIGYAFWARDAKSKGKLPTKPSPAAPWHYLNRPLLAAELWYARLTDQAADNDNLRAFFSTDYEIFHSIGNHWHLAVLGVAPNAQGKGIGTKLIQWGLDLAQEEKLPVTLEASIAGRKLYSKLGFELAGTCKITDDITGIAMVWYPDGTSKSKHEI